MLPVLHSLFCNWNIYGNIKTPHTLVIAPTRELAMQITTVTNEICKNIFETGVKSCKVSIVTVIGGMSEQKQQRLLSKESKKPIHILIATPGRLCELIENEELDAFKDMSTLKFLIVDEADRIMEEGHFAELLKVFSRIRLHEVCIIYCGLYNKVK